MSSNNPSSHTAQDDDTRIEMNDLTDEQHANVTVPLMMINAIQRASAEEEEEEEEEEAGEEQGVLPSNADNQGEEDGDEDELRDDALGAEAQSLLNIQNEISRPTTIMGFWRVGGNLLVMLYFIPVTVALLTVAIVDWHSTCNRPLKQWVVSQIVIQVALTLNHAIILLKLPTSSATNEEFSAGVRALAPYYVLKRILNLLWFSWFIVGMVWTFQALSSDNCPSTAPYLFRMCFALMVIQIFLVSLIMLFCCCSCIVLVLRVIANPADLQPAGAVPRGASDTLIRSLPVKRFKTGSMTPEDASCAICLSDYEEGEAIRYLPCNHHYHRNCIDKWLVTNKACPFCKRNIDEGPPPSTPPALSSSLHLETPPPPPSQPPAPPLSSSLEILSPPTLSTANLVDEDI